MNKKGFIYLGAVVTISVIAVILAATAYVLVNQSQNELVACTQEAKICPDGSAVGRTGQKCEFAPCPVVTDDETANWKTYRNEQYGFEVKYPNEGLIAFDLEHKNEPAEYFLCIGLERDGCKTIYLTIGIWNKNLLPSNWLNTQLRKIQPDGVISRTSINGIEMSKVEANLNDHYYFEDQRFVWEILLREKTLDQGKFILSTFRREKFLETSGTKQPPAVSLQPLPVSVKPELIVSGIPSVVRPADQLRVTVTAVNLPKNISIKAVLLAVSNGAGVFVGADSLDKIGAEPQAGGAIDENPPFDFGIGLPYDLVPHGKVKFLIDASLSALVGNEDHLQKQLTADVQVDSSPTNLKAEGSSAYWKFDDQDNSIHLFAPTICSDAPITSRVCPFGTVTELKVRSDFSDNVTRDALLDPTFRYEVKDKRIADAIIYNNLLKITAKAKGTTILNLSYGPQNLTLPIEVLGNYVPEVKYQISPSNPRVGQKVTIDASGSSDKDGDPLTYELIILGCKCDNPPLSSVLPDQKVEVNGPFLSFTPTHSGMYMVSVAAKDTNLITAAQKLSGRPIFDIFNILELMTKEIEIKVTP